LEDRVAFKKGRLQNSKHEFLYIDSGFEPTTPTFAFCVKILSLDSSNMFTSKTKLLASRDLLDNGLRVGVVINWT
jgi:hypothetical protein